MKKCKICNGELLPLIAYNKQPKAAQYFPTEQTIKYDLGIPLEIYQCKACQIVQIMDEPVDYYSHAIRSPSWDNDSFRGRQYKSFVEKFNLQNKRIKSIEEKPIAEKYDAFLMFNYLEHFPDPRQTLLQIYDNLENEGVGIIEVPNFDEIIRDRIFGEFIIDHLFYFTEKSLRLVCEMSGFDVLEISEIWEGASLSAIVKKRNRLSAIPFIDNQKELIQDMDNFIQEFDSVAIWGAGHQTLMMLTMLNNIDKVPYIIDSFEEKQNKYTHVTHKLVISPEKFKELQEKDNIVNGIIIIVGWQYREVLKKLKELNLNTKIALIKKALLEII